MKPFVVFSSVLFPPLEGFLEDFFRLLNASVVAHSPSYLLFLWCLLRNDSTLQFCFGKIVVLVNDKDKGIQKRIIKSYSSFFFYFTFLPSSSFLSPTFTSYSSSPFPLLIFSSSSISFFLLFFFLLPPPRLRHVSLPPFPRFLHSLPLQPCSQEHQENSRGFCTKAERSVCGKISELK